MADTFSCPECGVKLRRSPALRPGARVQCPKCSLHCSVPEEEAQDAPSTPPGSEAGRPGYGPSPGGINQRGEIERETPRDVPRGTRRADEGRDRYGDEEYDDRPADLLARGRDRYEDEDYDD